MFGLRSCECAGYCPLLYSATFEQYWCTDVHLRLEQYWCTDVHIRLGLSGVPVFRSNLAKRADYDRYTMSITSVLFVV